jgi:hypothetical protein
MKKDDQLSQLEKELKDTKLQLQQFKDQTLFLRKALWDMLNYAKMYVVILDPDMKIKLINYSLATALGFENEKQPLERCWEDFVPSDTKQLISQSHNKLAFSRGMKLTEVINEIQTLDKQRILVKWFNIPINSEYNMTLSFGLPRSNKPVELTGESIRSYYTDILERDKTMIEAMKESVLTKNSYSIGE